MTPHLDKFTATPGQTVFALASAPVSPSTVLAFVNGKEAVNGDEFSVVGNVFTWLNTDYTLNGDRVVVSYFT